MRRLKDRQDFHALRDAVAVRAAGGWSLYDGASCVSGLAPDGFELVLVAGGAVLRAGDAGRIWRVIGWTERSDDLRIAVRGPFGSTERILTISPGGGGPQALAGDWFDEAVRRALERRFGEDSASLVRRGDRVTGWVRTGPRRRAAVVGIAPGCHDRFVDDALASGLVNRSRIETAQSGPADLIVASAPPAISPIAERLAWFAKHAGVRLLDIATPGDAVEVRPHDQGSLPSQGRELWPLAAPGRNPIVDRLLAVAPGVLRHHRRAGDSCDRILMRGLEVAIARGCRASFGLGKRRKLLDDASFGEFEALVCQLEHIRSPERPSPNHPFYRVYPERWLAANLVDDLTVVDPLLDPAVVHEQVPAIRGQSRERIDLLALTRDRRLAVIELKAADDRALPLQGLGYWARVRWHHARREIERRGYFPGVRLDERPPVLYLVAPHFAMHRSVRIVSALFSEEVETTIVGLNSDWRTAPRVLVRRAAGS